MLDHVFLTVRNLSRSVAFYEAVLPELGITSRHDYDGNDGPPGHPDLEGFGANGRMFFWLREGIPHSEVVHVGFVAHSEMEVRQAYIAAIAAGATDNAAAGGAPGARLHYHPEYFAANVFDLDGHSIEFVYKKWQHPHDR